MNALLRFVAVLTTTVVACFLLMVVSINALNYVSVHRHGDIGPRGGFAIAIGSMAIALIALFLLSVATIYHQAKQSSRYHVAWPFGIAHTMSLGIWLVLFLSLIGLIW